MEQTCNGYHSCIVRSKLELRKIGSPTTFLSLVLHTLAQTAVGGHSAANADFLYSCLFSCLHKFIHQYVDEAFLETGTDILLVFLHKLRVLGHFIADKIKKGCLDT